MIKKCKKCKESFECPPEYPENNMCKTCFLKWREEALKCKSCQKPIEWHNYHWHDKQCDECFDSWKNVSVKKVP